MASTRSDKLHRKVANLLAGKRQRQEPLAMRLTGRAAEIWRDLIVLGGSLGLKPNEVMGLLLEHGGTSLEAALEAQGSHVQGRA